MFSLSQYHFIDRLLTFDDLSKKSQCKNIKFKRAFEFLQLLFLQRVYGIDIITRSSIRQLSKQQQQSEFEVFLGGSCNPTTWRCEQAIPYFQTHSVSYYNPQVANWTPDLVEIEHNAKESASLLFFVIDHDTRSLAAIAEVCYLVARKRTIIVIMNPMPNDKYQTKFIQQKKNFNEKDNQADYENVCEARETLRLLLQIKNIPVFDNLKVGLECAQFLITSRKQAINNCKHFDEEKHCKNNEKLARSHSNQTSFESPDNFYHDIHQSDMIESSLVPFYRRHSATSISKTILCSPSLSPFARSIHLTTGIHDYQSSLYRKSQISCSTNESDDDGYGSLVSSNYTLSRSPSSCVTSDFYEGFTEYPSENNSSKFSLSTSLLNIIISIFSAYISFLNFPTTSNLLITQSISILCRISFRSIANILFSSIENLITSNKESIHLNSSIDIFDLYIASGGHDEYWLDTCLLPILAKLNVKYVKRHSSHDNDQLDLVYDIYVRSRSRLLYYLINDMERLSNLVSELAYLIGERKHHIIVYLQSTIDRNSDKILTKTERQDIERSRKYLEDLAIKEHILLCQSREQSCHHVLAFFLHN
ncbi:unnamed protein product [Rotaria socialis]|uniref:Uncharacterized protein n=1 Tax=Rotaria socialis TaxID=392032 RepID=A0A820GHZ9_9BILA|nr:unnamed protein product [Rotaria socialis]CAF4278457.1 unnamed protein product [Rotaria socialis]